MVALESRPREEIKEKEKMKKGILNDLSKEAAIAIVTAGAGSLITTAAVVPGGGFALLTGMATGAVIAIAATTKGKR